MSSSIPSSHMLHLPPPTHSQSKHPQVKSYRFQNRQAPAADKMRALFAVLVLLPITHQFSSFCAWKAFRKALEDMS